MSADAPPTTTAVISPAAPAESSATFPTRSLYDFTRAELDEQFARWGFSAVHALHLWRGLYHGLISEGSELTELPEKVRQRVAAETHLESLPVVQALNSTDGFTRKYLLRLRDGREIETVRMQFTGRATACVSSQVGCAMGCVFCATGQMGFVRNLTTPEIIAQAIHLTRSLREAQAPTARHSTAPRLRNLVLMGMGEPLQNYESVLRATDILRDSAGLSLAGDRITLSTAGVVPGILRLARENRPIHLAVSLHAATQAERVALVPLARKWPLEELIDACRTYSRLTGKRIFYEWTLIAGQNDSPDHAHAVGALLRGLPAQVNLIPLNPTAGYPGEPTRSAEAKRFQDVLRSGYQIPSTIRQRRGIDIAAGCGQLASSRPPTSRPS